MRRREFITLLCGAATTWPLGARAQQPTRPVVGFLNTTSPDGYTERLRAFRQGLKETGYVGGENVTIEYRWAENQSDRLAAMAAELVRRRVAVILRLFPREDAHDFYGVADHVGSRLWVPWALFLLPFT